MRNDLDLGDQAAYDFEALRFVHGIRSFWNRHRDLVLRVAGFGGGFRIGCFQVDVQPKKYNHFAFVSVNVKTRVARAFHHMSTRKALAHFVGPARVGQRILGAAHILGERQLGTVVTA